MYLTQKNQIRNLDRAEFLALRELCRLSKNLYNVGLYTVRQYYFQEHKHLRYESAYHLCKDNENYRLLNTDIAQQTLKVVDRTFNSFYSLISAVKAGSYQQTVRLPHYLPKDGYFVLIIPRIKVVDGRKLKSINQWFNKENARLQSIKDKQKIERLTERQARLFVNRNNQIRDYLNKAAKLIVDHCITNQIGKVIVGFNLGMKQDINIGSRNNQNFVQIPFYSLRGKLKALCERYGLTYQEQEESYTSKASALDGDDLPTYNADKPATYQFSGKRVKRGLYRTKDGHLVNADCNGAANIGRKSKQNGFTGLSRGCLAQPLRVKVS
jgi:IS605 OrfB family transposase